ncbi:hypothetical protein [Pantoea sp.]|uniref:hypothetical protein n=1 Tax=Pantoea sp. TaxID=69393 RepID=UPI0031DA2773
MTTVASEGKKFVTVAAAFQFYPAVILRSTAANFSVLRQKKAAFVLTANHFRAMWASAFVLRCACRSVKVRNPQIAGMDRGENNQ